MDVQSAKQDVRFGSAELVVVAPDGTRMRLGRVAKFRNPFRQLLYIVFEKPVLEWNIALHNARMAERSQHAATNAAAEAPATMNHED